MNAETERDPHIIRIKQQLRKANSVWEQHEFPKAHRPNISRINSHILIGASSQPLQLHPALKPDILAQGRKHRKHNLLDKPPAKVSYYNFATRDLSFGTNTIELSDPELRRVVYRQVGMDMLNRESTILHNQYTDRQREVVTDVIQNAFDQNSITSITIDQTRILKPGFREIVVVDGHYVAEVGLSESIMMDRMYPTAFAIITDQILRRGGDIDRFDSSASSGQLQLVPEDDHPNFAETLFFALQYVDWRHILDALKSGEIDQSIDIINAHVKPPSSRVNAGAAMFVEFLKAMTVDKQNLATNARRTEAELN